MKTKISLILALILTVSATPVFAINSANNFTLTIDQARQRAVQTNRNLRTLAENLELSQDAFQRSEDQRLTMPVPNMQALIEAQASSMDARVGINQQRLESDILRGTIDFVVANYFANIYMALNELELYEKNIALMVSELSILRALVSVGFSSPSEYQIAAMQKELVIHNRQNLVNAIEQAHIALNRLIGVPLDRRHNLVFDLSYQDFEELVVINMTGFINHQRQTHSNVVQAQSAANVDAFLLENHLVPVDPMTGLPIPGHTTESERIAQYRQSSRITANARDSIERHIQDQYIDIRRLEQNIQTMLIELEDLNNLIPLLQTQLKVGEILPIELERHSFTIATLENEIKNSKLQHNIAVRLFRNPAISYYF